ncbi:ABC transporter permease [Burkholderia vietnamiensis]|uniref:ABC transporter permease n=1 Tax=Burkholderia vietnamiensis TaxID=60552 RepID=UPI00075E77B6|nr:ABC transporter permease [Burkholderia vietnamiensis]KVR88525.1 ABC transporter permease [Burkholderia vietnamiensis]KVS32320.1 ABC transporter permease [Burkholderia vietnamiensis]MBR8002143.1 ABC transporter permease [Burkholderia vietnamiensis]MCA7945978.1 ABC transporter permease [Burkholderia vietnamiensis]HDR8973930.1 ABC transporter permease [Burkholderia vietnamiensis]
MQQLTAVRGGESRTKLAVLDVVDGINAHPIWTTLAWQDIRQRYRRSVLGPFWITLTMVVTIAGMGPLYGALLNISTVEFVPYLALGIIVWGLISSLILDACNAFIGSDSIVRSVRLPLSLHVFRSVYRNILFFAHNILAFVPVMLYAKIVPNVQWLMVIPGLLIIVAASVPLSILLGIFCARFRDMQPIVGSIVQLAFFLTPIFWKPSALGHRAYVAHYNPLYMFLELVRGPLYGPLPDVSVYIGAGITTVILYALAIPLFIRFRSRIAFWI